MDPRIMRPARSLPKKLIAALLLLLLHSLLPHGTRSEEIAWTQVFGTSPSADVAYAVSADPSGVYVAGVVAGVLPGQVGAGGPADAFLRKYSHDGSILWTQQFGASASDTARAVHAVNGAVYVGGITLNAAAGRVDGFLRKHDAASGNVIWSRVLALGDVTSVRALSADASGIYLAGAVLIEGPTANDVDALVRKYDHEGTILWTRRFEGTPDLAGGMDATGIAAHASGVYVSGLTGATVGPTRVGGVDAYVRKYDAEGTEVWTRQFGTTVQDQAQGVAVDDSGVYVTGYTGGAFPGFTDAGTVDGFIRKYDHDGNESWTQQFGVPAASTEALGVAVDATGVYATGLLSPNFGFARKFNRDGAAQWSQSLTVGIARGISVAAGAVYVAGNTVDSGDAFLTRISQAGNQPPTADAGEDQVLEATSPDGASATLTGAGSSDPDNDSLTYAWSGPFGTSTVVSPSTVLPLGTHLITLVVDDGAGNADSDTVTVTVQDTAPPQTVITAYPPPRINTTVADLSFAGSDVATLPEHLEFQCRLDGAAFSPCSNPVRYTNLGGGSHVFEVRALDPSGNIDASPAFVTWTVDTQPPVLTVQRSPAANVHGWNNTDVTVTFTCTDDGGIAVPPVSPQVLTQEGAGQSASASCTDDAGNSATATEANINIDKTAPAISLSAPVNGATYTLGALVPASYTCSDARSGIGTCSGTTASGANISTSAAGSTVYTVHATDLAGNSVSLDHAYSVLFGFGGFRQPIDNLPRINKANAGKTIPVKWRLNDANGNPISDLGSLLSLLSAPIACDAAPSSIVEEQLNPTGGTTFRYDAGENQFIFNWDTSSSWRGCRLLQLRLADGSVHLAKFEFD